MSSTIRNTACLISLLLVIYVMREAHTSPGTFLKNHIVRLAQEQNISERFCGNGYDNVAFSSSEIQTADGYRSSLASMRGDKTLSNFIEEGEPKDTFVKNYAKSFIPYLVPWVVFFGLGIIGCLVCVVNWSYMNCSCLKRRAPSCCRAPKTPKFRNCFVILSVLFMTFTLGAGIAGIVFITNFPKYTHGALCSMVQFLEKVQDGSTEDKWIGLIPGINSLDELYNNITTTVGGLSEYNVLFNEFEQGLNNVSTSVEGLYENNRNQTLPRINPDDNTTYQPYYITELGPSTQNGTVTNQLGTALDQSKQTLEDNRNTLDSFLTNVQTDTDSVLKDISDNRPTLVQANQWLTDALNAFSNHESTIDMIIRIINGVLLGVTIANVVVAVVAIISILLVCCGSHFFNKSIHISWCILGLLMIVGFAASTALFGATILVSETCDVGNNALQSPDFFNKTFDRITVYFNLDTSDFNKTREVLYRCVYGDGDLSQEFNLTNNLVYFNDIFSSTNQLYTEINDQIDALPNTISGSLENNLNLFKDGLVPDSNETITDLETLNALTNSQFNPCTTAADTWLLNSQNCTTSEGTVFADTSASTFNVPQATCIGYNAWSTDPHSVADRYTTAVFSGLGCTSQNDDTFVISYINSLATNRNNSNELIAQLETEIQGIDSNYAIFVSDLQKAPQNLQDTNNTVAGIYYSLTDPNNGLIANTNCKFIVSAVDELRDVACTGVGSTFYKLTIALLVLSFVTFFGTFFLFCLAKRFTVKSDGQKVNPELYRVK